MPAIASTDVVLVKNLPDVQRITGSVSVDDRISASHTTQNITASLFSQVVLASNVDRLGACFFNAFSSKGNAYISFGTSVSTGSFMVAVRPGGYYSLDVASSEPISIIFDGVPGNVMVTEQT